MELGKFEKATALMSEIQTLTERKERLKTMIDGTEEDRSPRYNIRAWSEGKYGIAIDISPYYARSLLENQLTIVEGDIRNKQQQFKNI